MVALPVTVASAIIVWISQSMVGNVYWSSAGLQSNSQAQTREKKGKVALVIINLIATVLWYMFLCRGIKYSRSMVAKYARDISNLTGNWQIRYN